MRRTHSYRCSACGGEGHGCNSIQCPRRREAPDAASATVIPFVGPTIAVVEKHIKPSRRDLCIGSDLAAVRQVFKSLMNVQFETIFDEGMAVARSRKWESFILCVDDKIDSRALRELVCMYQDAPVIVVTSRLTTEMDTFYSEGGVMVRIVASDIASGQVDLGEWINRPIKYMRDKREEAEEKEREGRSGVLEHSRVLVAMKHATAPR